MVSPKYCDTLIVTGIFSIVFGTLLRFESCSLFSSLFSHAMLTLIVFVVPADISSSVIIPVYLLFPVFTIFLSFISCIEVMVIFVFSNSEKSNPISYLTETSVSLGLILILKVPVKQPNFLV